MKKNFFFKTDDLLIWRPTGVIKIEVVQEFIKFLEDVIVTRDPYFIRFIDLSSVEGISVNYEELYGIAADRRDQASKKFSNVIKLAFYVTNALSFGMARMYENLLDSTAYDIGIFYSLKEAADFLEVDISLLSD
jgi:hypothetical protein